ncbi:hypothetical protein [Pseudomonas paralcaligenes]|uniref:hypothetical protein n=1 Tax=Pseudomonas paralcaligenes TaxID=2772558 RepID=UPI001C7EAD28|nr:hypothetical protein [Pseudomonas paralcaligenes]
MAVIERLLALTLAGVAFSIGGTALAGEQPIRDQVVAVMQRDVAMRMAAFAEKIETCRSERRRNLPRLDAGALEAFQLSRDMWVDAIGHLSFRNRDACDRAERLELAYAFGALAAVRTEYGLGPDPLAHDVLTKTIYPDANRQELAVHYRAMPEAARAHLERTLGTAPFDLGGVLSQLGHQ